MREYRIYFNIRNTSYYAGSVRVLTKTMELYYHFSWGSRSAATILSKPNEVLGHWHLPDHISFHKDGKIHVKVKDDSYKKKYLDPIEIGLNPFNLEKGNFLPIFLESFDLSKYGSYSLIESRLKMENPPAKSGLIWNLGSTQKFSLLIISKCASVDPVRMTKNHIGLNNLTFIDKPIIIQDVFTKEEKDKLVSGSISQRSTELVFMLCSQTMAATSPLDDGSLNVCTYRLVPKLERIEEMKDVNN